jgi:hypothetical protein
MSGINARSVSWPHREDDVYRTLCRQRTAEIGGPGKRRFHSVVSRSQSSDLY